MSGLNGLSGIIHIHLAHMMGIIEQNRMTTA